MLDWTNIQGFQEVVSVQQSVTPPASIKLPTMLTDLIHSFGISAEQFNLVEDLASKNNLSWPERMVDRFTGYLDGKILEFQQWITQGLINIGQGCLMVVLAAGELVCFVYGISVVYRMMINTKKDEDYITKGIMAAGGYLVFRGLEVAIFNV